MVYPVISRRAGGLSVGVNLFPDRKRCSFDCPYCEVFPFRTDLRFSLSALERGLRAVLSDAAEKGAEVADVSFSGNGEPTLSPRFASALDRAAALRDELAPAASLVVITNGSTLADPAGASVLRRAASARSAGGFDLDIWVKLDAGTAEWYRTIDRGAAPFDSLIAGIEAFAAASPVTIQTMLCAVDGSPPPPAEEEAWTALALRLARTGNVRRFQLYGKARPAPEDPLAAALPTAYLEARAAALRAALPGALRSAGGPFAVPPVSVFP